MSMMKNKIFTLVFTIVLVSCTSTLVLNESPQNQLDCVQPENVQEAPILHGIIADFDEDNNQIELWNSNDNTTLLLGRVEILSGAISNQNQLAYIDADTREVKILSPQGKTLSTFSASKNWVELIDWTNNQQLLISSMPFRPDGSWYPPSSTIALNVDSGEYTELSPSYPNIYAYTSGPPDFGVYSYSLTAYDPVLTKVVYPAQTTDNFYLSLWDIPNEQEVARFQTSYSFGEVKWKGDGEVFVVSLPPTYNNKSGDISYVGGNELFLVGKDGEIRRLTYLTEKNVVNEYSLSWSPDKAKIAFWLKSETDTHKWQLAILNTKTGELASYCIDGEGSLPIIWSSDSNQLMSTFSNEEYTNHQFLLIDIQEKNSEMWSSNGKVVIGWFDE